MVLEFLGKEKQNHNVSTEFFRSFIMTGHTLKDSKSGKCNTHYSKGAKDVASNYYLTLVVGKLLGGIFMGFGKVNSLKSVI